LSDLNIPVLAPTPLAAPTLSTATLPPTPNRLEILLVEDNPINSKLGQRLLQKLGHNVNVAMDGKQGLDYMMAHPELDLVFLDIDMPVMRGDTTAKKFREYEGRQMVKDPLPLVALTGGVGSKDRQAALDAGMDQFVPKPCTLKLFEQITQGVMANKAARATSGV